MEKNCELQENFENTVQDKEVVKIKIEGNTDKISNMGHNIKGN